MLRDLEYEIRYAFRSLARRRAFSLAVIGLMTLGIGLTTSAFGVVNGLLLQAPPYDHPERLLVLSGTNAARGLRDMALSYPEVMDVKSSSRSLEAVAVVRLQRGMVEHGSAAVHATGARVSPAFFRVFGVRPRLGRPLLPGDDSPASVPAIVLSEDAWQAWYGQEPSAVGQSLTLDGTRYTVAGVMPRWFDYPTGADFWVPFIPGPPATDRASHYVSAVVRLTAGAPVDRARTELRVISDRLARAYPASDAEWQIEATPIREFLGGDTKTQVALAGAAAILVLLIACANVASLMLARGAAQQSETAVRHALGATTSRLVRQVLLESLVLAAAGALLGTLCAQLVGGVLRRAVPIAIPAWVSFSVHPTTLLFVIGATILSSIVAGTLPAVSAVRGIMPGFLGSRATISPQQLRILRGIVVAQVALATVLLAGAGLLGESLLQLRAVAPGFDPQRVMTAHVILTGPRYTDSAAKERFYAEVLRRLRALPAVQAAGAIDELPLASGVNRFSFTVDGEPQPPKGSEPVARSALLTPGYLSALRIPLLRGRDISASDDSGHPHVALVSASWANQFVPGRDPIGQRYHTPSGRSVTIVGVVGDVRHDGLQASGEPTVYTPLAQDPISEMTLVARAACDTPDQSRCSRAAFLAPEMRRVVTEVDPGITTGEVTPMVDIVARSLSSRRVGTLFSAAFALLALILATAGISGLMALQIARKRREVGIRLALGAQPREITRSLVGEAIRLAAAGALVGLALSFVTARTFAHLLYGVTQTNLPTLLLAGGLMIIVAALASWEPAARAGRISPARALRPE